MTKTGTLTQRKCACGGRLWRIVAGRYSFTVCKRCDFV